MGRRSNLPQIKSEELTEQSIQKRLNHFFASWKYNVDGLYVFEWESDKLIWTKSGYIYEFEIKISRADFKNDFKHKKDKHIILNGPTEEERFMPEFYRLYECNKQHFQSLEDCKARVAPYSRDLIANHKRPNYFYYAVPEGMIQPDEVPPYAGLIWILKEYKYIKQNYVIKKQAPCLHKQKYKDAELNLGEKFYYNWQNDRRLRLESDRDRNDTYRLLQEELRSKDQEMTYAQMKQLYEHTREEKAYYMKKYSELCRDQNIDRMIIHRLRRELLKLNPDFDYKALEEKCEKIMGI